MIATLEHEELKIQIRNGCSVNNALTTELILDSSSLYAELVASFNSAVYSLSNLTNISTSNPVYLKEKRISTDRFFCVMLNIHRYIPEKKVKQDAK